MERTSEPGTLCGGTGDFPSSVLPLGRAGVDGNVTLGDKPPEGRGYHFSLNLITTGWGLFHTSFSFRGQSRCL